jgi:hypothetical protein
MGVVVQLMVPADSAGVLFTCHPVTGDPRQMLITANFGLGEVCAYLDENLKGLGLNLWAVLPLKFFHNI